MEPSFKWKLSFQINGTSYYIGNDLKKEKAGIHEFFHCHVEVKHYGKYIETQRQILKEDKLYE